jgi:GTP-binding protein EngB required for normal cell division
MANEGGLNGPQKQHLLSSCQYADKLLSDIEEILHSSQSKSVFPKYSGALAPAQVRVVEDYIARIRSQILTALKSQNIAIPEPRFRTAHSIKVTLIFAGIAFEECTADKMTGYGDVPADVVPELNGLVTEIKAMLDQLNGFLSQGVEQDPAERLRRLARTGDEVQLLRKLERAITQHGLVDYRGRLSAILDRLESKSFEIALFGRVSSGKSSLLNHIVGANVLPVGVNPITAIPTRMVFGSAPRIQVTLTGQSPQVFEIGRISEFVTEQQNPANKKRVERLVVEYPSDKLSDGIVLVDTPGLGSLASAGAAETLAYLPRCDLGVVLIDAGSTLTAEDLSTLQALNEAAIETVVLLSKADLLARDDIARSRDYIAQQIRSNLRLDLAVHAVSVQPGFTDLLDRWFSEDLAPFYERHQQLTQESLKRKIGALRDVIAGVLQARLDRAEHRKSGPGTEVRESEALETKLRRVSGRFEEIRDQWYRRTLELREFGSTFLHEAAERIVESWRTNHSAAPVTWDSLSEMATLMAAEKATAIRSLMQGLAADLATVIREVSDLLGEDGASPAEEINSVVSEMPRIDLGSGDLRIGRPWFIQLSRWLAVRNVEGSLRDRAGSRIEDSFATYGSLLDAWSRRMAGELQLKFNNYADAHRARLAGLSSSPASEDAISINATLEDIQSPVEAEMVTQPASLTGARE